MAKYTINGADRRTGEDRTLTISAENVEGAERYAADNGVLVSRIEESADAGTTHASHAPQPAAPVYVPSQALPALVNVFLPGVGQLIQGRFVAWIVWWVVFALSAISMMIAIGFITTPILWLVCIVDAAKYKPKPPQVVRA